MHVVSPSMSDPPPQVNFSVGALSASNLTVDNLSVKNVEYSKVDRCAPDPGCIKPNPFAT
jgi:hypothetical protein